MDILGSLSGASGLGSILGGLSGLFGSGKKNKNDPSQAANSYLNQIPGTLGTYLNSYILQGQQTSPQLQQMYSQLMGNPGQQYNQLGAGYKESPGYQFKLQQALGAAGNAAAAGGTLGTPMHQQNSMQIANDIASQDYESYLNHILDLYKVGLGGNENLATRGYDASSRLAENLGSNLSQQANYKYAGQAGKNLSNQQNWSNIFGGLGQAAPWLFGGLGSGGGMSSDMYGGS
jgi:hypothetical protein